MRWEIWDMRNRRYEEWGMGDMIYQIWEIWDVRNRIYENTRYEKYEI